MPELEVARKKLSDNLRDRMGQYWEYMKDWYKRKITKDKFDSEAKFLLGENYLHLHNEFLFALLVRCQTGRFQNRLSSSSESPAPPPTPPPPLTPQIVVPSPVSPVSPTPPQIQTPSSLPPASPYQPSPPPLPLAPIIPEPESEPLPIKPPPLKKPRPQPPPDIPYQALDSIKYHEPQVVSVRPRDLDQILLCSHERLLPDLPTLHTRMLLVAWELELDAVTENTAELLMLALRQYLKNVLQALISSQSSWQNRKGSNFQHSFGFGPSSRPLLYPAHSVQAVCDGLSSAPSVDGLGEAEEMRLASLNVPVHKSEPLNLFHLRDALKVNKHCIPIQSMYSLNMERILAGMWHPSEEEETQKKVVDNWKESLKKDPPYAIRTTLTNGHR